MNTETLLTLAKVVVYIGTVLVALGTIGVSHFTSKLDKAKDQKIDSLLSGNQRLEQGNRELLGRVDVYQKDLASKQEEINTLKFKATRSGRGLVSVWDFNGVRREGSAGSKNATGGEEIGVYQELERLQQEKKFTEVVAIATKQITKTPDWLTPYLFRGAAYANLGELQKAAVDLRHVVSSAGGDPTYAQAQVLLVQIEQRLK